MWDTANAYAGTAETGGLLTLLLYLTIITRAFRSVGRARAFFEAEREKQLYFWSIGAALFAHCVAFFGIGYYDQTIVAWYALLAIIVAATAASVTVHAPVHLPTPTQRFDFQSWGDSRAKTLPQHLGIKTP
jgi:hypothetical protein